MSRVIDYGIEAVVKKARREWPHLADDLEQEIRLAYWLASIKPVPEGKRRAPGFARTQAKLRGIDFLRKFQGQPERGKKFYRVPTVSYIDDAYQGSD